MINNCKYFRFKILQWFCIYLVSLCFIVVVTDLKDCRDYRNWFSIIIDFLFIMTFGGTLQFLYRIRMTVMMVLTIRQEIFIFEYGIILLFHTQLYFFTFGMMFIGKRMRMIINLVFPCILKLKLVDLISYSFKLVPSFHNRFVHLIHWIPNRLYIYNYCIYRICWW